MERSPLENMDVAHQNPAMPEVANLGVIRPPLVYLAAIVLG
jgi:hypothetical protein